MLQVDEYGFGKNEKVSSNLYEGDGEIKRGNHGFIIKGEAGLKCCVIEAMELVLLWPVFELNDVGSAVMV